jgi:signal transduction histidine kinase/ActR/RegA family two-component response regulator
MAPALVFLYFTKQPWLGFVIGLLALVAAWYGGERFVIRQIRSFLDATRRLGAGDLAARTGLARESAEIVQLAGTFDKMAANLEQTIREHEQDEQRSLSRALQQTTVAALSQFALTSNDFTALLNQGVTLISQTLEVEFCRILELLPENKAMLFRAGAGWKKGLIGISVIDADPTSQAGYTLKSGEPVVISDLRKETRFKSDPLLEEHRIVSGVSVAIAARGKIYGVLAVYSTRTRNFNSDDLQFLLAAANALAIAVEHRRAEAEVKKLADFAQLNPNPAMEFSTKAAITYFNPAALKLAQSIGCDHPSQILPLDIEKTIQTCLTTGRSQSVETKIEGHSLSWAFHPMTSSQVVHAYVADITERLNLEAQLRQSQKMESVGQLAAGVAHDFNNMLTVIQGHAGMLLTRPNLSSEARDSAQAVSFAAERAAGLTRQLLLFSRKSVMQPQPLDLREIINSMTRMIKRVLGETITLEFNPPLEIPSISGDTGMIEQILMNLAVNARDAMALGGRLTIELNAVSIGEDYLEARPEGRAGRFVRLRVIDTGHGMNAATMARVFEPFFTTKEPGKGTGLGLATVYGIVKQHEGWIELESEVGKGTTFSVFFPATAETAAVPQTPDVVAAQVRGNGETILVVEDEASVLAMGRMILQDCGYRTLEASSGVEALELWRQHQDSIQLLLTDMVMPHGLSGLELAQQMVAQRPSLKVLFTSGYFADEFELDLYLFHHEGAMFLQKPYTRSSLAKAVRASLDKKSDSSSDEITSPPASIP